jgi:putative zinc finger protein
LTATGTPDEHRTPLRSPRLRKPSRSRRESKRVRGTVPLATCASEVALIGDYLASRLSPRMLNAFEKHLDDCLDCASFLRTYKKTIEVTRSFLRLESTKHRPPRFPYWSRDYTNSNC